jgi:hypothetical protein
MRVMFGFFGKESRGHFSLELYPEKNGVILADLTIMFNAKEKPAPLVSGQDFEASMTDIGE